MDTRTSNRALDLVETARNMVDAAVAVATGRLQLSSLDETVRLLDSRDRLAIHHFRVELARQVASALLMMDPHVVAVFDDRHDDGFAPGEPLRLWVQVSHRTAALSTVVDALNQALVQALARVFGEPVTDAIEAMIVDDRDSRLLQNRMARLSPAPILLVHRG